MQNTKDTPILEIKLVNLMKIILDAQWIIDEIVFSDMLNLCGFNQIFDSYIQFSKNDKFNENEYVYISNDENPTSKKFRVTF